MIQPAAYLLRKKGEDLYVVGGPYQWADEVAIHTGVLAYLGTLPEEDENPTIYLLTFDSLGEGQIEILDDEVLDAIVDMSKEDWGPRGEEENDL